MTTARQTTIYTLGHSSHAAPELIALLKQHQIALVVDVRSQPYSRWSPQFNRETLIQSLRDAGIGYRFMGDVLGGRPADRSLYDPGEERPDYDRMAQRPEYQDGISALLDLAQKDRMALLCSEGDHAHCHRHLLLAQSLLERSADVLHIQPDGGTVQAKPLPKQLSLFGF